MKELKIQKSDFGDSRDYPVINSLVGIFEDEEDNIKRYKYCIRLLNKYHTLLNEYNSLNKETRKYTYLLIKQDFINRIDSSILSDKLKNHMKNLINAIVNRKIEVFIDRK